MQAHISDHFLAFVKQHENEDTHRLLLSASRHPELNIPHAVEHILSRRIAREKLPEWHANERVIYPSRLAMEQCSSAQTATYKQRFARNLHSSCDLTGGLGVDSFYLASAVDEHHYVERFANYSAAAKHNFQQLGATNIHVHCGDCEEMLTSLPDAVDLIYIDPARRGDGNSRLFAVADCEPNLQSLQSRLFEKSPTLLAKLSPMLDLSQTLRDLDRVAETHILSVRNECKELLLLLRREERLPSDEIPIHCVNFTTQNTVETFIFTRRDEQEAVVSHVDKLGAYLYEPNASLLKAGAFKSLALRFGVKKLHPSSHLYTSDEPVTGFPGRSFSVTEWIPFSSKAAKRLSQRIPQANIACRNFHLSVEALRRATRIREGGDCYVFATTMSHGERGLAVCRKEKP